MSDDPSDPKLGRRRARVACQHCNFRKVRCNVASVGQPCTNCRSDDVECQIKPRKKRVSTRTHTVDYATTANDTRVPQVPPASPRPGDAAQPPATMASPVSIRSHAEPSPVNRAALTYIGDDGETPDSLGQLLQTVDSSAVLAFDGYLIPGTTSRRTPAEDLDFLRLKGTFSLPAKKVCDEAVLLYFRNCHALLPILDAKAFLDQYLKHGFQGVSLILLWSILHVAASFLPLNTVKNLGYQTKKELKLAMCQHVKLLYDNNQEIDHLSMVQAALILGYWHPDSTDRFEAWHWTGIAISMCQSMRLHRANLGSRFRGLPSATKALARRIWWSCVIRDRWLAVIKDRPTRINLEDCDVEIPTPSDVAEELDTIDHHIRDKYFGYDGDSAGKVWCQLVQLSITLGKVSQLHSAKSLRMNGEELSSYERELQSYTNVDDVTKSTGRYERFFAAQVGIHHEAVNIMLFRPFILSHPDSQAVDQQRRNEAAQKTRVAAVKINGYLEQILGQDLVEFLSPSMISPLILAMQIHLLDCKSPVRSTSRLGHHRLQLCMMVQAELRETYWGADQTFQLFEQAQNKLLKMPKRRESQSTSSEVPANSGSPMTAPQTKKLSMSHEQAQVTPSVDDLLAFDLAFTEPHNFEMFDVTYMNHGPEFMNSMITPMEFNGFIDMGHANDFSG